MHTGIKQPQTICEYNNVRVEKAEMQWLVCHSILGAQDAVILGASNVAQIEGNTRDPKKKRPLLCKVVKELDASWDVVDEDALAV